MEERRNWFTDVMAEGNFPEDLAGFYLLKNPPPPEPEDDAEVFFFSFLFFLFFFECTTKSFA